MITGITHFPLDSSATQVGNKQVLGKDDFLKLLVAQLSAQDPLNPLDNQEFSALLAQFSALEQITNVNANLEALRELQLATTNASLISLIGKNVDVQGNTFEFPQGQPINLSYSLAEDAETVKVDVFDSSGSKVASVNGNTLTAGKGIAVFNGLDLSGNPLPSGTYSFTVIAQNASGGTVLSQTFSTGIVTDVLFEDNQSFVVVNGEKIPAELITRVSI